MDKNREIHLSKFLSLVLRHKPEVINLQLDANGWANVKDILSNPKEPMDMSELSQVVLNNDKQRFSLDLVNMKIRASQGHSIKVDLQLKEATPPDYLYHGTSSKFIQNIIEYGIKPMNRHHVHLSMDKETAKKVGNRHGGKLIIIKISTGDMNEHGMRFYLSDNNVWLCTYVDPHYFDSITLE
jgi:putative RNA 2'-phosphotransferase